MNLIKLFNGKGQQLSNDSAKFKASERIQINNVLAGICITAITILITFGRNTLSSLDSLVIGLLAVAIPLLITSSLCYSKMTYRGDTEIEVWNFFALFQHTLGYNLIINSLVIFLISRHFNFPAIALMLSSFILFLLYSIIDIVLQPARFSERMTKFVLYIISLAVSFIPAFFLAKFRY